MPNFGNFQIVVGIFLLLFINCIILSGELNKVYRNTVSLEQSKAYVFHVDRRFIQRSHTTKLRAEVATHESSSLRYPLLFVVRQQRQITSMEVPYVYEDSADTSAFYKAGHTLCIDDADDDDRQGRNVTIRVTTESVKPVPFYLILRLTEDFQLPLGKELTFEVTPTAPRYFGFTFSKPDMDLVKIRATSPTSNCMTVSVQHAHCPVHDSEENVRHRGLWQTMSTSAAMTVRKTRGYNDGFFLVFVTHMDKEVCGGRDFFSSSSSSNKTKVSPSGYGQWDFWDDNNLDRSPAPNKYGRNQKDPRNKIVTLMLTDESQLSDGIIAACLLIPIAVTFLVSFAVLLLFRNRHEWLARILTAEFEPGPNSSPLLENGATQEDSVSFSDAETAPASPTLATSSPARARPLSSSIPSVPATKQQTGGWMWKSEVYIANFQCKQFHEVKKFTKRFYWTIIIVAIFYSIPVYQLVLHYLRVLYRTGEYDICYYNYLCAHRLGVLIDFNHFWSNASYVIFGIIYIVIVRRRSSNLCLQQTEEQEAANNHHHHHGNDEEDQEGFSCCYCCGWSRSSGRGSGSGSSSPGKVGQGKASTCCCTFSKTCFRWDHGVPPHFGVFYALGLALMMEGFLSAAYHLCPNQSTFQFDTAFMYVIAVLLLLKIYQFRHPVHFGANHTFAILAGFVVISVVGLIVETGSEKAVLIFKCIFIPIQFIVMIFLSVYYYAVGFVKNEHHELVTDWSIMGRLGQLRKQPIHGDRLIFPIISFTICILVVVYSEVGDIGFASYLLYLLVGNVLGTTLYYVGIMKPLHGEFKNWTWVQPALYFLAAGVIGGFSLQYFVRAPAQWELSASASRAVNEECLSWWFPFHPFYDSHDAWHFLSAAALFLAFMGLLIVDDDLITTSQDKIPVF